MILDSPKLRVASKSDLVSDSVTCYFCKHQHLSGNLKAERLKEDTFIDKVFDNWKKSFSKFDKHHCHRRLKTWWLISSTSA